MNKQIAIIGGGPGGYTAAIRAAQLGARVVLIEKDHLGGTCLNRGCIPTKAMYKSAEVLQTIRKSEEYGIGASVGEISGARIRSRCQGISAQLRNGIEQLVKSNGIELIRGSARFSGDGREVLVATAEGPLVSVEPDAVIIATGSRVQSLPLPGVQLPGVISSDELLEMEDIPKSMVVIGGGVIGMEFASIYGALGTTVTVLECDKILRMLDDDIQKRFMASFKKSGAVAHSGAFAKEIRQDGSGLTVAVAEGERTFEASGEYVLIAVGRSPVTEGLGLEAAGVEYSRQGIRIDAGFQTTAEGIYAIGDVTGGMMLAHWAAHQGLLAVEGIMGCETAHCVGPVPGCIFTFPELAYCGLTEKEAKEQYGDGVKTSKFMLGANGKALASGSGEGLVKTVAAPDGTLVGVHIMGAHSSDLIHEGVLAVTHKMKAIDLKAVIHAHPTISEALYESWMGLIGEAIHQAPSRR